MFQASGRQKPIIRIIAIITVICFIAYDFAWAYPASDRTNPNTLAQRTLFTAGDKPESLARAVAKYLEVLMLKDFRNMPLAGVQEMLARVRSIASSQIQIEDMEIQVAGGAVEGQVFVSISDDCVLRYFNPKMANLTFPVGITKVAWEYPINEYMSFQLLKVEDAPVKDKKAPKEKKKRPKGRRSRKRPPEGSIYEGYNTLLKEFKGAEFTLEDFREKRVSSKDKIFSDRTVRTELNGLVALGIVDVDTSEKAYRYRIKNVFERGPPEMVHALRSILADLPASPEEDQLEPTKKRVSDLVHETAIKTMADVVDFYFENRNTYPAISTVLFFWPERPLTEDEKGKIKERLRNKEKEEYLEKALAEIHRENIDAQGNRVLHLGETVHSLVKEVPHLEIPSEVIKTMPEVGELTIKDMRAIRSAIGELPTNMAWIGAIYYGFWGYFHPLFNDPKTTGEAVISGLKSAKSVFLRKLPESVSKKISKEYEDFLSRTAGPLKGDPLDILIFPHFIAALGRKISAFAGEGDIVPDITTKEKGKPKRGKRKSKIEKYLDRSREALRKKDFFSAADHARKVLMKEDWLNTEARELLAIIDEAWLKFYIRIEDAYYRDRKPVSEIAKMFEVGKKRVTLALRLAGQDILQALPAPLRRVMLKDNTEELIISRIGPSAVAYRYDRFKEVAARISKVRDERRDEAKKKELGFVEMIEFGNDYMRFFFASTDSFRVDGEGRTRLSRQFCDRFKAKGPVVLVERPESRILEIWPEENLSERSDQFDLEWSVKEALETLLANPGMFGKAPFTLERFHQQRRDDRGYKVHSLTTGRELDALVQLGVLDIDPDAKTPTYFMTEVTKRAPPLKITVIKMFLENVPSLNYLAGVKRVLDKIEELYGWDLLDSVTDKGDFDIDEMHLYEQKLLALYKEPDYIKGDADQVKKVILHFNSVADVAEKVARRCGYNETDVLRFRIAAAFHDIGKTISPENLALHYSNKLKKDMTPEEARTLEGHDRDSFRMLKRMGVTLPFEAVFMVALNHEPELMSIVRRTVPRLWMKTAIFAVVDQFCAITEPRPYPRDITLDTGKKVDEWLDEKYKKGEISGNIKDYMGPVLARNIPDQEDDKPGAEYMGGVFAMPIEDVSLWIQVSVAIFAIFFIANLRALYRLFRAKWRLSRYLAEKDPERKFELKNKWDIEDKQGSDSISVVRGVRVFASEDSVGTTETLYVGPRMRFIYLPLRILLWLNAKRKERQFRKKVEQNEYFSNSNMRAIREIKAGTIENATEAVERRFAEGETKLRDICLAISELEKLGHKFPQAPAEKLLGRIKVTQFLTLGRALYHIQEGSASGQECAVMIYDLLQSKLRFMDPQKTAGTDLEQIYLILLAIKGFDEEQVAREKATIQWEQDFKRDLLREYIGERASGQSAETVSPEETTPDEVPDQKDSPEETTPDEVPDQKEVPREVTQAPQPEVDKRNDILRVFDAIMQDASLRKDRFTNDDFKKRTENIFVAGTAIHSLKQLTELKILDVTRFSDKSVLYQLNDKCNEVRADVLETVRSILYNLPDDPKYREKMDARGQIIDILGLEGYSGGPDPRNYLQSGVAPGTGVGASLAIFAGFLGLFFSVLNLWTLARILLAERRLAGFFQEEDDNRREERRKKHKILRHVEGRHYIWVGIGLLVETTASKGDKEITTNIVVDSSWAHLFYFPILLARGIKKLADENIKLYRAIKKAKRDWHDYLTLPEDDPEREEARSKIEKPYGRKYAYAAEGVRVYGRGKRNEKVFTWTRVRSDSRIVLQYFPLGLFLWFKQVIFTYLVALKNLVFWPFRMTWRLLVKIKQTVSVSIHLLRFRARLKNNALFNNAGMKEFLGRTSGSPHYDDFVKRLANACIEIDTMYKDGWDFLVIPDSYKFLWKIKVEEGLLLNDALNRQTDSDLEKVYSFLYKKIKGIDLNWPRLEELEKLGDIYHIAVAIKNMPVKEDEEDEGSEGKPGSKGLIGRIIRLLLPLIFLVLIPFNALAAPPNLSYTYYSPSGRIETETYVDDWDANTPADPSDDVPAGTVVRRIDEAFYDPGTPADPSDDYGRPDRKTHPDVSYEEYEYYTGTDNIHFIRGYDSGGAPVFVYEVINASFAIKTYTNGAGATYHLDSGNQYVNTERDADDTVRTYEYDASWNLTERMIFHPGGNLEREDHTQQVVEVWTPGWQFARGANLWVRYGYDIGDGVNGETYEGLSTKRDQLLQDLDRFKGWTMRYILFCDIRAGVTFDGGGTPTGFDTQAHVFADMDALVEAAQDLGIRLIPVLFDYTLADNVNMEGPNPVGEYPDLITDNAKRAALVNVMRPFIQRYAGNPVITAWDVMNEPVEITTSTTITMAQVQTFLTDFVNMIHSEDPGSIVTVGAQNRQILLDNWTGLGLDLYQPHYYDYMLPSYPLTDAVTTWGSGLGSIFFGELEPTSITTKLTDIYNSGVNGGGLFWQDDSGFTITNTQADTIRHWYDSAAPRPFPPIIVSVTDSNGSRTFTITWQPYTGALAGSADGYTIRIDGETFFVPGVGTSTTDITLPNHLYSGNYDLSIRTEMPDGQTDGDYSAPVIIWGGRSPSETRGGGSCAMQTGKMEPGSVFGTLLPYGILIMALLIMRSMTRRKREEGSSEEDVTEEPKVSKAEAIDILVTRTLGAKINFPFAWKKLPESLVSPDPEQSVAAHTTERKKEEDPLAVGNVLEGFNAILKEKAFREDSFTRKGFQEKREKEDGKNFSYTTITSELEGLFELGILEADKTQRLFSYELQSAIARAPPVIIDRIRAILDTLPARPTTKHLSGIKKDIEKEIAIATAVFSKTYEVPFQNDFVRVAVIKEFDADASSFDIDLPSGFKLSTLVKEIFMNAYEAVGRKRNALDGDAQAEYQGRIQLVSRAFSDNLHVEIIDNGIGIEGEQGHILSIPGMRQIADMPVSHKGEGGGSGLSVVGKVLADSGGFMSLRNTDEGGVRVFMTVPLNVLGRGSSDRGRKFPAFGNVLEGFNTVLNETLLRDKSFTSKEFNPFRKNKDGKPFSYKTIKSELDGMVALGILRAKEPARKFEPIKYTLTERYRRADKLLPEVRKLLELLSPRPDKEELEWARAKLDNQVFAEGADVAYYYMLVIPQINAKLRRLGAERVTLDKKLRKEPNNTEIKEQLETCMKEIRSLVEDLTLEYKLLSSPDYPLDRTKGINYRDEARELVRKALANIGPKNESAAAALLNAAKQRFAQESYYLQETELRMKGPAVWKDIEEKMLCIMQGQYRMHEISGGRKVPVSDHIKHKSKYTWQGIRSQDRQIDGMLREIDRLKVLGKRLSPVVDVLEEKRRKLPKAKTGELLPQPEVTAEEKETIEGLLLDLQKDLANAKNSELRIKAREENRQARKLFDKGEYRAMLEELAVVRSLLRRRYSELLKKIEGIRKGRLASLREDIRERNNWNIKKLDKILDMFNRGDRDKARRWWLGIMRDKNIRNEPEFSRMHAVLAQVKDMFFEDGKEETVRRNIGIMKERVRLAEVLNSFMENLRDTYADARLRGAPESVYDSIFAEKFNQYLAFAKKNNIGRGSPRLLWTHFYLAAYVSMNMPDPKKPSKKIKNPLFPAMLDLVRMLEINNIPALAKRFEKMSKKYANLYQVLKDYQNIGYTELDVLSEGEWLRLLRAMARDASLSAEMKNTFLKAAAVSTGTTALADTSGSQVPWQDIWAEYVDQIRLKELYVSGVDRFRDLIWSSLRPAYWPELFEEEWEEGFVKEISALSSAQLAEKFLTYFPDRQKRMKDLREVRSFTYGDATLGDIYFNIYQNLGSELEEDRMRKNKEAAWIVREWIYRHWDDIPKEVSYDVIKRSRTPEGPVPTPVDLAADLISGYYDAEKLLEKNTTAKTTTEGGVFMSSSAFMLRLAAERYLDRTKSVLDLGSGNAYAVSVFAQYARYVRGVEIDSELHEEGRRCVAELSGVVDSEKVDLVNGNFFDEDMTRYDLIYIYWPGYGDADKEKRIWQDLNEKLVKEMKPGAVFVVLGGADLPAFRGLERMEPLDPAYALSSVYRKPEEPAREDSAEKKKADASKAIGTDLLHEHEKAKKKWTDLRETEQKFIEAFKEKKDISWVHKGHRVRATVQFDDIFENFIVAPEDAYKRDHPELAALDKPVGQWFIAPEGSFGHIEVEFKIINDRPVVIFDELQTSYGYRDLRGKHGRKTYQLWAENALRFMVNTAKELGIETFYASRKERIEKRFDVQKIGITDINLWENYVLPFKDKGWSPVTIDLSDQEGDVPQDGSLQSEWALASGPEEKTDLEELYRRFYGTEIPKKVLDILLAPVSQKRVSIEAIERVLSTLEESLTLKPQMSEELARSMVNFLVLINPDLKNPLTMTAVGRYRKMLDDINSKEFQERYSVFNPEIAKNCTALDIGLGYPAFSTEEFGEVWPGETIGADVILANKVLVLQVIGQAKDLDEKERDIIPVTVYILLGRLPNGEIFFTNMTVTSDSERIIAAVQSALTQDMDKFKREVEAVVAFEANRQHSETDIVVGEDRWAGKIFKVDPNCPLDVIQNDVRVTGIGLADVPYELLEKEGINVIEGDAFSLKEILRKTKKEKVDVIRIMNVLIYFPEEKRQEFLAEAAKALNDEGVLIEGMASPNGTEFIYIFYKKIGGELVKVEEMFSPTNLRRPLWPIRDENDACIRAQTELLRAVHRPLRANKQTLKAISKEGISEEARDDLVRKKIAELKSKVRLSGNDPDQGEEGQRQLRIEIFNYLRSVPYESVSADLDPVRGPAQILAGWGGTCVSKTYLAGLLFKEAGYEVNYAYVPFEWRTAAENLFTEDAKKRYSHEYDQLENLSGKLNNIPYLHLFLKIQIDEKTRINFDTTWDNEINWALAEGGERTWDGISDLTIAITPLKEEGVDHYGDGRAGQVIIGSDETPDINRIARIIDVLYEEFHKDPEYNENTRLFLRQLSDLLWWMRAEGVVRNLPPEMNVKVNEIGAISRFYDLAASESSHATNFQKAITDIQANGDAEPVTMDLSDQEGDVPNEDLDGALLWELEEENYDFTGASNKSTVAELPRTDVMKKMEWIVPEVVNGLMTAGYDEKVVLVIDDELGPDWTRKQLRKMMNSLRYLSRGDDQLARFLKNIVIRHGKGETLARSLDSLVERGDVRKENIIIITSEANLKEHFSKFEGTSTITGINDKEMTDDFYYPLIEIVLFTLARALKYDRENLIRCYRSISNRMDLDDNAIWEQCWDPATNTYKTTMIIRLIPGADKIPGDRGLYKEIRKYIASRA